MTVVVAAPGLPGGAAHRATRSPAPTARACCTPAPRWPPTARWSPPAGRVLSVTAVGPDLAAARQAAYERVAGVRLAGAHWRTDIALAAVEGRITVG